MKNHTKIYLTALGYDICDFIPSELSGRKAVDINHIECRGMGGDPTGDKDRIENLMAVTREEHIKYGDRKHFIAFLFKKHKEFLKRRNIPFDEDFINKKIELWSLDKCKNAFN